MIYQFKETFIKLIYVLVILYLANCVAPLQYRDDGTFKIVQITDVHFGEGESVSWGPIQDKRSLRVMTTILEIEKPDLVVLTGDLITGNNIKDNATAYWEIMLTPMIKGGYKWAFVFGNHDSLASGKGGSREDLMKFDRSFAGSLSQFGPSDIDGVSNYVLQVEPPTGSKASPTLLYMLDSNNSGCEGQVGSGCILPSQVEWYRDTAKEYQRKFGKIPPALAFFHIPLQEYMDLWNNSPCSGTNNDSVSCQALNTGLFSSLVEAGDVKGVFVGHNHGNDFCGNHTGILLCFGRHSGYGGYGNWERGARVIQLTQGKGEEWSFDTWIRFETGEKQDKGQIHTPSPPYQTTCSD